MDGNNFPDLEANPSLKASVGAYRTKKRMQKCFSGCKGKNTDKGITFASSIFVNIIGAAAFSVSVFCILIESGIVDIAAVILCCFSPYMIYQKWILRDLGTFRKLLNDLRSKINEFMLENDKLTENVDKLKASVTELEKVESDLCSIVQSDNIDRLVEVIRETKEVNTQIRKNTQAAIVQHLITTVLRTDRDDDLQISPRELKNLMLRLDAQPGFDFHKDRFIQHLGSDQDPVPIEKIMSVIRNLKDDSIPEDGHIFTLHTDY